MRPRREAAIERATETTAFAGYSRDGSDGTRTRDLRRDRPVRRSRRLTTMDAQSLYSCGFPGFRPRAFAWLSQADFRRLLPVCCPIDRQKVTAGVHTPGLRGAVRTRMWAWA